MAKKNNNGVGVLFIVVECPTKEALHAVPEIIYFFLLFVLINYRPNALLTQQITLVQEGSVVRAITRLDELCREVCTI